MLLGFGLSSLGDFLAVTALALYLHDTGRPPIAVSALMLAGLLPLVLLGPVAGAAVDRFETTALLRIVLAVEAVLAAALAFVGPLWLIFVLVFALGTGTAIIQSGVLALLPTLAPADRLVRLNGWFEALRSVGVTLGAPLGGVLAGMWGARALLVDAATFAVLCAALWQVPGRTAAARTAEPPATRGRPAWRALVEGVEYIARDRQLRFAVLMLTVVTFFLAGVSVVEVYFARDTLRTEATGYGALVGAWGVGMIFGALGTARWVPATGLMFVVVGVGLLAGVALIVPAVFPVLPVALTGWLLAGTTNGAYHVAMRSLLHRRTPAGLHGRVFGAQFAAYNAAKVASMVTAGPVVALLQPRATILVMGIAAVATGVGGTAWLATRRVRAG